MWVGEMVVLQPAGDALEFPHQEPDVGWGDGGPVNGSSE